MKGSYWFRAKSKKVLFEFSIRRNITVIKGDSATGKTTLLRILYEYLRIGRQSGYAVSTNASYYVYIRDEVGRDWKDALYPLKNTVIFIEENNEFVFTKEFASYVKESGNYFVFVTRAPLKMLPYSIHEIYEIITDGKRTDIKESYHEFKEIYSNYPIIENNKIQNVVTEDSNSGYQFWMHAFKNSNVTSSNGNGNLIKCVKELGLGDTLVIADGAGGIRMTEPALDLGIVLALVSSFKDISISEKTICFGEVGLSGEVRAVNMAQQRVQEAKKLGFETCILPKVCLRNMGKTEGIQLIGVSDVREAIQAILANGKKV